MYSIVSEDRRIITEYVKEQAYLWLYEEIRNDHYTATDTFAEDLIQRIKEAREIKEETYDKFLKVFCNDPCEYLLNKSKNGNGKITAASPDNYFLKYNGAVLPVGFVKGFFEDDYETVEEIRRYYEEYTNSSIEEFQLTCGRKALDQKKRMEIFRKDQRLFLDPDLVFHVTNFMKLLILIFSYVLCFGFFKEIDIVGVIKSFNETKALPGNEDFIRIIVHAFFLIVLVILTIRFIRTIAFYAEWVVFKIRVNRYQKILESANVDAKEFASDLMGQLSCMDWSAPDYRTIDNRPLSKRYRYLLYLAEEKHAEFNEYAVDATKRYISLNDGRGKWIWGVIGYLLLFIIIAAVNNPAVREWLNSVIGG